MCVALLPFRDGEPDWDGFEKSVSWMLKCAEFSGVEIAFVLNADTGYIFNLSIELYGRCSAALGLFSWVTIICGLQQSGQKGKPSARVVFSSHDQIQQYENAEVMLMTSRQLNILDSEPRRDAIIRFWNMSIHNCAH